MNLNPKPDSGSFVGVNPHLDRNPQQGVNHLHVHPKQACYEERPRQRMGMMIAIVIISLLPLTWFIAGALGKLNPAMLPTIQEVGHAFWDLIFPSGDETLFSPKQLFKYSNFGGNFADTAFRIGISSLIGIPLGIFVAALASISSPVRVLLYAVVWVFYSIPKVLLLVPVTMLGLVGSRSAIGAGAIAAFSMMFIATYAPLSTVNLQGMIDNARALGLRRMQILFLVVLPSPSTESGIANALVLAVNSASGGVVVAELFSTSSGLGSLLRVALTNDRLPEMYAIGLCGMALIAIGLVLRTLYLRYARRMWGVIHHRWHVFFYSRT